jgi:hypothetical protein
MTLPPEMLAGRGTSVVSVSTVLPAVALLGPLLVLGAVALALARPLRSTRAGTDPAPLFTLRVAEAAGRLRDRVRAAAVTDQYRSIFNPLAFEAAASSGTPLLWVAALVALGFALTR